MVKWWGVTLLSCNNRNNCGVFISLFLSPGSLPLHEKSLMIFDGLQWPTWTPWKSPRLSSCINLRSSITCRVLLWIQDLEKNWIHHFLSVYVDKVLDSIPHHTDYLERIEIITFVCHHAEDNKISTLASIWPLAPLVPPKGWLDTKESLAFKVFV